MVSVWLLNKENPKHYVLGFCFYQYSVYCNTLLVHKQINTALDF